MARMTIAQLREREVLRLAKFRSEDQTDEDIKEARRLMTSYYRLAGLDDRLLYLANDERTCNSRYTKSCEDKAYKWYKRLSAEFTKFCGFRLQYFGAIASIVNQDNYRMISTYWYN